MLEELHGIQNQVVQQLEILQKEFVGPIQTLLGKNKCSKSVEKKLLFSELELNNLSSLNIKWLIAIRAAQENVFYIDNKNKVAVERHHSLALLVEFVNRMTTSYVKYFERIETCHSSYRKAFDRRPRLQRYVDHICSEKYDGQISLDRLLEIPRTQVKSLLGLMLRLLVTRGWKGEQKNDLKRLNWFVGMFSKTNYMYVR